MYRKATERIVLSLACALGLIFFVSCASEVSCSERALASESEVPDHEKPSSGDDGVKTASLTVDGAPYDRGEAQEPADEDWLVLPGPSLDGWKPRLGPHEPPSLGPQPGGPEGLVALATGFNARVFRSPGSQHIFGEVRRGNRLAVEPASGPGCTDGEWYSLRERNGYVCTSAGFIVSDEPPLEYEDRQRQPDISVPLGLDHAKVITPGAPRLSRLPTREEAGKLDAVAEGELNHRSLGDLVAVRMVGDFFLAVDKEVMHEGERYIRTVKGQYVRARDIEMMEPPTMHGEHLGETYELPLAFVYLEDSPVYCRSESSARGELEHCGEARRFSRFNVENIVLQQDEEWVLSREGFLIQRSAVRIAEKIEQPSKVQRNPKWVHVDLGEQTLVAYEGTTPIFATMISSGREGYTTPTGTWRTTRKYLTRTMRGGRVPIDFYYVEEVPWAIFYNRGYAVHGAYWHNNFGQVQSRGCTNVPPADARWLFFWSTLAIPENWHAVTWSPGIWWHFTRD